MYRSTERFLTTHAGSLPRPGSLTALYAARARGESIDENALHREAQAAVANIIPRQIEAGIDVGNNGEQPREAFFLYVQRRMSGFGGAGERKLWGDVVKYPDFMEDRVRAFDGKDTVSNMAPPKVIGDIKYLERAQVEEECAQFESVLAAQPKGFQESFLTAPSPGIVAAAIPNEHYDSFEAYLGAITAALKVEYETIVSRGHLLQLDCPDLAMERHISFLDRPLGEFIHFIEQVVGAINEALTNIPKDRVRLHVCWGNYEGPHDLDVPLADILQPILHARAGAFLFSMANPRHAHEHACFRGNVLDDDQLLLAGVIDTTTNFVEHPEVVAERIERVARAIDDPTRVIAATDCGFDTSAGMGRVAESIVWAKLKAMSEGAAIASKRLFA
ncbi:MAG: cobalamin-independent methionine synthase II family protein [Chromatiales bacterium]|nr:cobalamin-independent methionine synthase II family protein [Chromatiales bacterium]